VVAQPPGGLRPFRAGGGIAAAGAIIAHDEVCRSETRHHPEDCHPLVST
jgi:hypothetical protein